MVCTESLHFLLLLLLLFLGNSRLLARPPARSRSVGRAELSSRECGPPGVLLALERWRGSSSAVAATAPVLLAAIGRRRGCFQVTVVVVAVCLCLRCSAAIILFRRSTFSPAHSTRLDSNRLGSLAEVPLSLSLACIWLSPWFSFPTSSFPFCRLLA